MLSFVRGLSLHLVHNRLRRDRNCLQTVALDRDPIGEDPWHEHERLDQMRHLQNARRQLEPLDRRILTMTLVEGLKPCEIADRLGLSSELVRQRRCRALRDLVAAIGRGSTGSRTGFPPEPSPR